MPENEMKGITVKVDAALHAEVKQYIESHGMTMAEFVSKALDDELHSRSAERNNEKMKTLACQVPEETFQRIKEYLHRHHMTQKQFITGLIEAELNRDISMNAEQSVQNNDTEINEDENDESEEFDEEESEEESEDEAVSMGM